MPDPTTAPDAGHSRRTPLWRSLPVGLLLLAAATAQQQPDAAPGPIDEREAAIAQACALLLANQEIYQPDPPVGTLPESRLPHWQQEEHERLKALRKQAADDAAEWPYEGVYRVGPDGRIPSGYRVGSTAIVCEALLLAPGDKAPRAAAITRGLRFSLAALQKDPTLAARKQTSYDVRGWGHIYALGCFVLVLQQQPDLLAADTGLAEALQAMVPDLIGRIATAELRGGGWNYAGRACSPFMTGACLLALYRAAAAGHEVDAAMVERALDALQRGRDDSTAYAYSGPLRPGRQEPMQGSSARSSIAELALHLAGRSDTEDLGKAVDAFLLEENWRELHKRKSQQGTHAAPYGVAPYYFFFGHTYAALATEHLAEDRRHACRQRMSALLARTLQANGGWNDRVFPRTESYATAMAVLALCAETSPRYPAYQTADGEPGKR
jgi:hypothetical protein